jgi:hypothetical protein
VALVAALAALGAWSAWRLYEMGSVARRIIADNYVSVVAAQDMKESLKRQDSAALFELLGRHDRAAQQLEEHRRRFDEALERAAGNITEPGERELIETLRQGRAKYYRRFDVFLAEAVRTAPRRRKRKRSSSGTSPCSSPSSTASARTPTGCFG